MKSRFICAAVVLVAAFVTHLPSATAGGWTQAEGAGYAKAWFTYLSGQGAFGLDGGAVNTEPFTITKVSVYGEYGLRDDLTLVAFAEPVGSAKHGDNATAYTGNYLAGVRQRLVSAGFQLAIEARAGGSPGWGDEELAPNLPDASFVPAVKTGRVEWDLQLGIAHPIGWVAISGGPRLLTAPTLSDEISGFAQLGFGPFAGFVVDLHVSLNHTLRPLEVVNTSGVGNTRYIGPGIGLSYWPVDFFGLHVAADGAAYAASNARAAAYQFGVEFRTR